MTISHSFVEAMLPLDQASNGYLAVPPPLSTSASGRPNDHTRDLAIILYFGHQLHLADVAWQRIKETRGVIVKYCAIFIHEERPPTNRRAGIPRLRFTIALTIRRYARWGLWIG